MISRRSLLASLGLALPATVATVDAKAAEARHLPHHARRHTHTASVRTLHHHKTHRTASVMRVHPQA